MLEQNMLHRYMARKYILSLQVWETNFYSESITHISPQKTNGRPLIINMGGLKLHNPWNTPGQLSAFFSHANVAKNGVLAVVIFDQPEN